MPRSSSVRTVAGYGESLRDRLKAAGLTHAQLANAAGISRQTISRALSRDQLSAETERRIADALSRSIGPSEHVDRPTYFVPQPWARAVDLAHWSDRRDSQHELPALVRDLIRLTTPEYSYLSFPAGESIQQPGFDGVVVASKATAFVPAGRSVWEVSTNKRIVEKATADIEKRSMSGED